MFYSESTPAPFVVIGHVAKALDNSAVHIESVGKASTVESMAAVILSTTGVRSVLSDEAPMLLDRYLAFPEKAQNRISESPIDIGKAIRIRNEERGKYSTSSCSSQTAQFVNNPYATICWHVRDDVFSCIDRSEVTNSQRS